MAAQKRIAVIGTGLMGLPMAQNLLSAGHRLSVWNRSMEKAIPLGAEGARMAASPADCVAGAEFILTSLTDGSVTGRMIGDAALRAALTKGAIWIDTSSIKPGEARAQAAELAAAGIGYLDAPVSGGTRGAMAGSLAIMAGGDAATFAAAGPVLAPLGRAVHVGPTGAGQLAKLANQAIVAVTISVVAEAMLMLEKGSADPAAVRDALQGGFADSTILRQHGARMTEGDFRPGGRTDVQIKDLTNILEEAATLGITLPETARIAERFQRLSSVLGHGDLDHSALYLELLDLNGLG